MLTVVKDEQQSKAPAKMLVTGGLCVVDLLLRQGHPWLHIYREANPCLLEVQAVSLRSSLSSAHIPTGAVHPGLSGDLIISGQTLPPHASAILEHTPSGRRQEHSCRSRSSSPLYPLAFSHPRLHL